MSRSTAAALPFGLTEEQQTISGMVREFADSEIAPHALEWDAEHHFPVDVIKRSADLGMGGIYVSEEAGGTGMGRMDAALIFEAMSTACPSVAAYISIHNMVAWMIDKYGDAAQKEKYLSPLVSMDHLGSYCLTEPNAGSDAAALRTSAREDGDSYVLNGVKQFISGAGTSETYLVMARTGQDGSRGISAFILEKGMEGLSFGPNEQKMGWRAQPTRQVIMENVRVPKENLLGEPGQGFKIAMSGLDGGRLNIGACSLGGGQSALEKAIDYMGERQAFGTELSAFQALRFEVAEMQTKLEAARSLLWRAASAYDSGDPNTSLLSAMAKLTATDSGFDVANRALQLHGGYGYLTEYGIEKLVRDLRVHQILEGTNEIMRVIISRKSTGVG
ncbi:MULTISPECIES: acyl-CoA dehydrogenase family protein [Brevibacterium]|uniref:Acyl-CoA dehydrogenase n=1 Tax=Brevibacterium aurantiacum TaxID=273384 RepID=A0A2A3YUC6_BREAU|nr:MULTISPECIES: acyl-CoA dehydrogenase family protein [Brevibacterium]MDN5551344.1 acyl-CoA dehydrogenase family protein [Brevibacterium sp.]AZL05248.1 acyl-CoA dehydrogenase [Brevibacterium aurantiacum]MDN5595018.1 acyl-CoA dehydrogenase family protein [Brevibacterium sp.]MDN5606810.1 acyl-CoA dehydrogenase family protein [Brevibacterium sp.]MDN5712753.1 acyl-CoA dehydrogenase family protein [Brevibacterium aurantiacum]